MAHDVFISYSTEKESIANAVCTALESNGIKCWIAPRDIPPGEHFAASLINAIKSSKIMVLILSEGTNSSEYVFRELNEAVANGLTIISFRIEEVDPADKLGFYINSTQWLNAFDPPMERHIEKLVESVLANLAVQPQAPTKETDSELYAVPIKKKSFPVWTLALIGLAVVIVIGVIGLWIVPMFNASPQPQNTPTVAPVVGASDEDVSEPIPSIEVPSVTSWSEWSPLEFEFPSDFLWHENEDGSYTAIDQHEVDAFAWSKNPIDGDFILNLDITSDNDYHLGHIIAYGTTMGFSDGNLIFLIGDENVIKKHSPYIDEELTLLAGFNADLVNKGQTYNVTIEVIDRKASLFIDGKKVISAALDDEVNNKGKIGLNKYWQWGSITFSNIKIKTKNVSD